jgi:hypothetical protein
MEGRKMKDRGWKTEDGGRRMEDEEWRTEDGVQRRTEDGRK